MRGLVNSLGAFFNKLDLICVTHVKCFRYGPLFRTNILGSKTVFSTDQEINFEIFRQENKSFVFSYPDMFVKVLGKDNLFFKTGNIHKFIKQITLHLLGAEGLKRKMIGHIDQATREHLRSRASEGAFNVRDAVSKVIKSTSYSLSLTTFSSCLNNISFAVGISVHDTEDDKQPRTRDANKAY